MKNTCLAIAAVLGISVLGMATQIRSTLWTVDPRTVTAIVNVADDMILHGLSISPDLDTVTYTLAEAIDPDRGGRRLRR